MAGEQVTFGRGREKPGSPRYLPLDAVRDGFALLTSGPRPLTLDCRPFPALPDADVPLGELRGLLLQRRCPPRSRDAVWAAMVGRARLQGATWTLACTGMALPGLARVVRALSVRCPQEAGDVHAEVLAGYLAALAEADVEAPHVLARLLRAGHRHGLVALRAADSAPLPLPPGVGSTPPPRPWGHPDLVLAQAVRVGVLTRTEADVIGATRLEEQSLQLWASRHERSAEAAYKARRRAEQRLLAHLAECAPE
ncbi:hypothetical protein [Streptomyces sp. ODS28]|uniref:hypothetical protein n=1 Tax=Streptomyces sp. ODS28 TaxID=3136688 RepID=UPI0031EFC493